MAFVFSNPKRLAALLTCSLTPLYFISYQYQVRNHPYSGHRSKHWTSHKPHNGVSSADDFAKKWVQVHVDGPFNITPIRDACENQKQWRANPIFNLDDANGGIGNIRGNILDFLFQAITSGSSIVLPTFFHRSTTDLTNLADHRVTLDHFFDTSYFLHNMQAGCPQMKILPNNDNLPHLEGIYGPISMRADLYPGETPERWARILDEWCAERGFDPAKQTSVNLFRCLWEFDLMTEAYQLRRSLGRVLQLRADVRRLAAITVYRLGEQFSLQLDPSDRMHRDAFVGAHLRTSADAEKAGWLNDAHGSFDGQTDDHLALAAAANLSVIYVATGNAVDLARFADKAWEERRVNVTSKSALLTGADLDELNALSWDQQALVDYEVLLKCSRFAGFTKSSYSWNIAIRRNLVGQEWNKIEGIEVKKDPYKVLQEEEEVAFDDGLSRLGGRDGWHEMKIPKGMWP